MMFTHLNEISENKEQKKSSIDFCVIMMATGFQSHHLLTSEMIKRIHKRFREEKIVIPFPIQTLDLQPKHEEIFRKLVNLSVEN